MTSLLLSAHAVRTITTQLLGHPFVFQDLLQVLPKEDAGVVGGRPHELSAAVSGGCKAGRAGRCSQQSL